MARYVYSTKGLSFNDNASVERSESVVGELRFSGSFQLIERYMNPRALCDS